MFKISGQVSDMVSHIKDEQDFTALTPDQKSLVGMVLAFELMADAGISEANDMGMMDEVPGSVIANAIGVSVAAFGPILAAQIAAERLGFHRATGGVHLPVLGNKGVSCGR